MFFDSIFSRRLSGIWLSLLVALTAGCASTPGSVEISETEEIGAIVTAVDQSQRLVTVRGPQGNEVTLAAGPDVRNLAQVRVGDTVRVIYEQTYIATLTDAEEVDPFVPVTVGAAVAELGERPGAAVGAMATMTVRVESVGPNGRTVTFSEPDGPHGSSHARFTRCLRVINRNGHRGCQKHRTSIFDSCLDSGRASSEPRRLSSLRRPVQRMGRNV